MASQVDEKNSSTFADSTFVPAVLVAVNDRPIVQDDSKASVLLPTSARRATGTKRWLLTP